MAASGLLTAAQVEEIRAAYRASETLLPRDLAEKYGVGTSTIQYHLRKVGLGPRPWKVWVKTPPKIQLSATVLEGMLYDGLSLREMGKKLGCSRKTVSRRLVDAGLPLPKRGCHGPKNGMWAGGRHRDKDGYWLIHAPNHPYADHRGYVREHRLVVEAKIGRYLTHNEVVHHIDFDKGNNEIENLALYESNGAHLADTLTGKEPEDWHGGHWWWHVGRAAMELGAAHEETTHRLERERPDYVEPAPMWSEEEVAAAQAVGF